MIDKRIVPNRISGLKEVPTRARSLIIVALVLAVAIGLVLLCLWHVSAAKRTRAELEAYEDLGVAKDMVIAGLKSRIFTLEGIITQSADRLPAELLKIYAHDAQADIGTVSFCIATHGDYTLAQKLDLAAAMLMKYQFPKGRIEVARIEARADQKIAVVDLRETRDCPIAWKGYYFQGSSGGGATTSMLTNTFLQPHYSGTWVDGVEFLYEGAPIKGGEWDHIRLHGTMLRK